MHNSKIGLVSGDKKNPLDNVYFFSKKDLIKNGQDTKPFSVEKHEISNLISDQFQEYIFVVFAKNKDRIKHISEALDKYYKEKDIKPLIN